MAVALTPFDVAAIAAVALGLVLVVRRDMPKAYALGLVIMGVFAVDLVAGFFGARPPTFALAFVAADVAQGERLWSPVTSLFAHAGLGHLLGNLVILLTAGPALEDRIGSRRFLVVYFLAGFVALGAHVVLAYATDLVRPESLAVGASGAIFGVLTMFAVRHPREKLPLLLFLFVLWIPSFALLLLYLGLNLFYLFGLGGQGVAWWGHFAGFLVGLVFAYALPGQERRPAAGLPDPDKLVPLATSQDLKRILERIRQFSPETRTADDPVYVDAWLDRFFQRAACPQCGAPFTREGTRATCASGETTVDFARG